MLMQKVIKFSNIPALMLSVYTVIPLDIYSKVAGCSALSGCA